MPAVKLTAQEWVTNLESETCKLGWKSEGLRSIMGRGGWVLQGYPAAKGIWQTNILTSAIYPA